MLSLRFLLLLFLPAALSAQVTLVPGAVNDTFDLGAVELSVRDIAVLKGRPGPAYSDQPDRKVVNWLHWRYFDQFLGRNAIYPTQLLTQPCTQLVDELPDEEFVTINITIAGVDSAEHALTFVLSLAGLQKWQLDQAPLQGLADHDPEAPQRFSAVARIRMPDGTDETYDSLDGQLEIETFDVKKQRIQGNFYLEANRIGKRKKAWFFNGAFR